MYQPAGVTTSPKFPVPERMRAWVLCGPQELTLSTKPVPVPKRAEVLVRIDAVAICATDLEVIYHGPPAMIQGGAPFNKDFTPGHEYMGTVAALGPGVDEFEIGDRITVEIHNGCGQCKRCRQGMYTSCHNYGLNYGDVDKGHRANGFTTDGGFAEYNVNNINTIIKIPDAMSDEEATLVVTDGNTEQANRTGPRHDHALAGHQAAELCQPIHVSRVMQAVRAFTDFTEENDPYGEHDFGNFTLDGADVFWKIDYYDNDLRHGSPNATDAALTKRVLTILLAEEY